jgi:NitT/TauT family transport system permease protein
MGATGWRVLRRVILPATAPSIVTGAAIGMGITWEVVVAAEMISGGRDGEGGGLGHFMWNAYLASDHELIVVSMISIGLAGYVSSSLLREIGRRLTPWLLRK